MRYLYLILMFVVISGCNQLSLKKDSQYQEFLITSYDFQIVDPSTQQRIDVKALANKLQDVDVVFIGEYHGNHASHLLQAQLQSALFVQNPNQVLSMEQFTTDKQAVLDAYLDDEIGEKVLIKQANAWPNYVGSYRPLIEFSKRHFLPVYAANAPIKHVRCVGREGEFYLDKYKQDEFLPRQPFLNDDAYEEKFMSFMMTVSNSSRNPKQSYSAQLLRDNSMAETILSALKNHPKSQVIHLNGAFHSDQFLGTVALLKKRNPNVSVAVISPVRVDNSNKPKYQPSDLERGNFVYLVTKQPANYQQAKNRIQAFRAMFKQSKSQDCI